MNSGKSIQVPVGVSTLGRIMNVLGDPIDEKGPIGEEERWSIHRAAPSYEDQSNSNDRWRPASRLSTWYARSPRVVRLVCSVVPV